MLFILLMIFPGSLSWRFSQSCWELQLLYFCSFLFSAFSSLSNTTANNTLSTWHCSHSFTQPILKGQTLSGCTFKDGTEYEVSDGISFIHFWLFLDLRSTFPPCQTSQHDSEYLWLCGWHSISDIMMKPAVTTDLQLHVPVLNTWIFAQQRVACLLSTSLRNVPLWKKPFTL